MSRDARADKAYLSYEDYDTSSSFYDNTRAALGVDIIVGLLATSGHPLAACSVLDIGCGTGNYLGALAPYVQDLVGLEYSPGMLARARAKTAALESVRLVRGSAFSLPFPDRCFHALMFNQVVHHFDPGGRSHDRASFPMLEQALREALRVLAPGGLLLINHAMQEQMHDGYWWAALIPEAMSRMAERYVAMPVLEAMLVDIGFEYGGATVPLDAILQAHDYANPAGPLGEEWRRGDSTWTLATPEELTAGLDRLRAMIADGTVTAWLAERERLRRRVGQTVYVHARRPRD